MQAEAFVPGHITGFFEVFNSRDPLLSGSRGCGVVLSKGTFTKVNAREGEAIDVDIYVNGRPCDCPVTRHVVDRIGKMSGTKYSIRIEHRLELPMKYGFGMSGAGALGTAIALNRALELGLTRDDCGRIAHEAEVLNGTGLGDVIAELTGGLVLRTRPGAPGVGCVEKIPLESSVVVYLVGDELETREVLLDRKKIERINMAGRKSFESFIHTSTPDNFLRSSWSFARETGLVNEKIYLAANTLANKGVIASMAMLGNALFTLTQDAAEVLGLLDYPYVITEVNNDGAKI
jgi:pantoate kinase